MKNLTLIIAVTLFSLSSAIAQEKSHVVTASLEEYEGSVFTFYDEFEEYHFFDVCDAVVLKKYDITKPEYIYETFKITYVIVQNKDGDDILKITNLVLIESEEEIEE